jgi:curli production assembly/transport component CsgG/holdfast attachment protein HfaB
MTPRARRILRKPLAMTLIGIMLAGCATTTASPVTGRYAAPIGDSPVISNETPYSRALECLAAFNAGRPAPRIAVGQIADYTGKLESDGSGRKLTQGAALMAISALSKAGAHLVERFDTSVAELELKYANNKLIAGSPQDGYRKILAGSIPGSDYYLVGGITELNFNIRSDGADAFGAGLSTSSLKGSLDYKVYVMNVGLDLRLVDTKTLEVVDVISYQKQIVGREIQAGVFDILGTHIVNADAGDSALEPVQLAVRSVIERAVLEMVGRIYRASPGVCAVANDPMYDRSPYATYPQGYPYQPAPYQQPYPQPAYYAPNPAYNQENFNEYARQIPYSGYGSSDPVGNVRLRAGY